MTDIDIKRVRDDLGGFTGRFFYDAESGDIGWIAKDCDAKHCDCEVHLNADGDQDCSHSLADWEGEDHINEPIVRMLNVVPDLLAEVVRLRTALTDVLTMTQPFAIEYKHDSRVDLEAIRSAIRAAVGGER